MIIRLLEKNDYYKNFLNLQNSFTSKPEKINFEDFSKVFDNISDCIILVIELDNTIIATGKILIEQKFHNNLKKMGHIEDIVVSKKYRNRNYGTKIIEELIKIGKEKKCYKISLNCNNENINFYKRFGFIEKGKELNYYI